MKGSLNIKRYGNLYHKIYDINNLRTAHKMARKGKTWYREIKMVDAEPEKYLTELQKMLINKTYKTSKYSSFIKNDKGKQRKIFKLPYYPDRICQWAIMLQIEDILLNTFIYDTYASIPNRGIHKALKRVNKAMTDREGTQYCLKFDIKKYFPSINQDVLKQLLRKKFKDKDLLWLLDEIIDSADEGIPIGNYLSQYLANFYLTYFDHWLKEEMKCKYYFRYMDDLVILHSNKEFLHDLKKKADEYLWNNLKLTIKENWQVFPTYVRGLDFVGYRSFGDYTLLRKTTSKQLKRKMNKLKKKEVLNFNDFCSVNSYLGWVKWGNCYNLKTKYLLPLLDKEVEEI